MERLQYSPLTIQEFRRDIHHLASFVLQKTGEEYFSEKLGAEYLRTTIDFPSETPHPLTTNECDCIRCVRRIGEYQLYGALKPRSTKVKDSTGWELDDKKIISSFIESMQAADNSEATKKLRIRHIQQFYGFIGSRKIDRVHSISAQIISDYAASLQGDSPVYSKHRLATLRFYFRFLRQKWYLGL